MGASVRPKLCYEQLRGDWVESSMSKVESRIGLNYLPRVAWTDIQILCGCKPEIFLRKNTREWGSVGSFRFLLNEAE